MRPSLHPRWTLIGGVLLALLAAGCGDKPSVEFDSAAITAAPQANDNSATEVDVVLVYDQTLDDSLVKMSASDWFAGKAQFLRDHPDGVSVSSWEVVPGQKLNAKIDQKDKAWNAFVFANYLSPGAHRIRLDKSGTITLGLGDNDVALGSGAGG